MSRRREVFEDPPLPSGSTAVDLSHLSEIHLYSLGDIHVGALAHERSAFKKAIELIRQDPIGYWIGIGDYAEFIANLHDPRFTLQDFKSLPASEAMDWIGKQIDRVLEIFKPIKDRCLGILDGNHERSFQKYSALIDVTSRIAKELGVPRLGDIAIIDVKLRVDARHKKVLRVWAAHGWGSSRLKSGAALTLERAGSHYDADVYFMGHLHQNLAFTTVVFSTTGTGVMRKRTKAFVMAAGFRGPASYALNKGYGYSGPGLGLVEVKPIWRRIESPNGKKATYVDWEIRATTITF